MSYDIIKNLRAYSFDRTDNPNSEDSFLLVVDVAANNVFPRYFTTVTVGAGWNYRCVAELCEMAGGAEGGCIQNTNGWTTPERIIKLGRLALKNATPLPDYIKTVEDAKNYVGVIA